MKSLDAAKASLVFIKNRRNSSHLQMFFKIGVLKNFVIFTGKQWCFFLSFFWSFFLIKLQVFRCFSMSISILLRAAFFIEHLRWRLQQMLSYIIFSKRRCWIYCSFALHNCVIVKPKIVLIIFHFLYHSLPFVLPLGVIHCHSLHHSLSLDVSLVYLFITQQTHKRWINVEATLIVNVHQRCFNVDIWLKVKVEPT